MSLEFVVNFLTSSSFVSFGILLAQLRSLEQSLEKPDAMEKVFVLGLAMLLDKLKDAGLVPRVALFEHYDGLFEQVIRPINKDKLIGHFLHPLCELSHRLDLLIATGVAGCEEVPIPAELEKDGGDSSHRLFLFCLVSQCLFLNCGLFLLCFLLGLLIVLFIGGNLRVFFGLLDHGCLDKDHCLEPE